MTEFEARTILSLRDADSPARDGLIAYKEACEVRMEQTASRSEKAKCRREIQAVDKLLSHLTEV